MPHLERYNRQAANPSQGRDAIAALEQSAGYRWFVVGMLWLVCFFNYAERQAIFSVYPLIKTELKLSNMELGLIAASFMWMYAIAGPFAGRLCDRLPRKSLVLGALIFWSLVTACISFSHNAVQLAACTALGGLGEAFYFPAAMSLLSDYHAADTRSRAMSLHQTGVYIGTIGGATIAGLLGQRYGFRTGFIFFGIAGILTGLLLALMLREPVRGAADAIAAERATPVAIADSNSSKSLFDVLTRPVVLSLMAAFLGANFVAVVFLTWMPTFLYQKFHLTLAMAGLNATAYLQLASLLGVLFGGVLADSIARRKRGGRMLVQAVGLFCGAPFLLLIGWMNALPVVIAAMVCTGFCKGMYDANIFAGLYDVVPLHRRGVAAGLLNSVGWLGGGFAPIYIAMGTKHFGMGASISATAVLYIACALLLFTSSRKISSIAPSSQAYD